MKIAIVTGSFPQVSETFIINHVVSLIETGHEVKVISFDESEAIVKHQTYNLYNLDSINYIEREKFSNRNKRLASYLRDGLKMLFYNTKVFFKLLRSDIKNKHTFFSALSHVKIYNNSDLIHAHFGPIGARIANLKAIGLVDEKIPLVCSFHGYDIDSPTLYRNERFYRSLFKYCSVYFSNSIYLKNKLIDTSCNAEKIKVLKVGVDTNIFIPNRLTEKNNSLYNIITVARLVEVKGIIYAIKAVQSLIEKGITNIVYNIIGNGQLYNEFSTYIKKNNLDQYIILLGSLPQEAIIEHYSQADLFILSSIVSSEGRAEAQGLVLQEAQAMSLPVIATNVGGIPEGLINSQTGFVVLEKSPYAIAEKIEYLVKNPDKAKQMGVRGRQYVKENFDLKIITEKMISIYEDLLNEQ